MKPQNDRFRDEGLSELLDAAIRDGQGAGSRAARAPLYDRLRRLSGLPGPRMNDALVRAFAAEVARRGAAADPLLSALRDFHVDVAPLGHVDEFLAILGVAGTGARAAADAKARAKLVESLSEASWDPRSRVRVEVTVGLVAVGVEVGPAFAETLHRWIEDDDAFLARAAIDAAADPALLPVLGAEVAGRLLDATYARIARERRAARRSDGFNRLLRAVEVAAPAMVVRFPSIAEVLERQAQGDDEDVRETLQASIALLRKGRASDRAQAIEQHLAATKKPSRDPRWDRLPGKRGRGR